MNVNSNVEKKYPQVIQRYQSFKYIKYLFNPYAGEEHKFPDISS